MFCKLNNINNIILVTFKNRKQELLNKDFCYRLGTNIVAALITPNEFAPIIKLGHLSKQNTNCLVLPFCEVVID